MDDDIKKICSSCERELSLVCYYKNKLGKHGRHSQCKDCERERKKKYRDEHLEFDKERHQKYYIENKERINNAHKEYYKQNKEKELRRSKEYKEKNKDTIKKRNKIYDTKNREKLSLRKRNKRRNDLPTKIKSNLRSRLTKIIRENKYKKSGSVIKDLGCSVDELKIYLENKFYLRLSTSEMMSWENYGMYGWHIDHIVPLSSFNLADREQFLRACHYTNLQPMWAEENLTKSNKH